MAISNAGELRSQLAAEGKTWTVNPKLTNQDPLPKYSLGGDKTGLIEAATAPRVDVVALVAKDPPTNALLRADLIARHILPAGELEVNVGSRGSANPAALHPAAVLAPPAGGGPITATAVDWRNRFGWNWITEIRDQTSSEHCWIYSAIALVEAMVRVEHCVWCDRSEGDYIEANKITRGQTGNPSTPLNWIESNGVCDLVCVPWADMTSDPHTGTYWTGAANTPPPAWSPPFDRDGRTLKIPAYTSIGNMADQKSWIDNIGPIVTFFEVYSDFYGWSGSTPYSKSSTAADEGGHFMLIVGYDDSKNCWIVKNSWGTGWGDSGFGLIEYGQCDIDSYSKMGLQYTNPDPWTKRRSHGGGMIESGDGALHRNFELIAPSAGGSMTHWWRDNSSGSLPWAKAEVLGNDSSGHPATLTGTTYNRNFEFLYTTGTGQIRHWYFDQSAGKWNEAELFASGVAGSVGFVESNYGPGNFEVVYRNTVGQLQHYWRDNGFTWHEGVQFAANVALMGPTLVQSTWGNLEVVAVCESGQMQHYWRNDGGNMAWTGTTPFGAGVQSPPCMIQGQYGMGNENQNGNFELCVAMPDGTVQHWWRDNAGSLVWSHSATFGANVKAVIALVEGSFGFNLELIVLRIDNNLQHYWRDGNGWHAGVTIGPSV